MEAAFPYEETVDQLRSAEEVKADLERGRPMDRLVVGDVGYGKTEVALRAAFKVIQDGMQVAVLVPTTVLAAQHLETFRQRFAAYPITIRMLSRFVAPGRAAGDAGRAGRPGRSTSSSARTGCCRKDVAFRDLGLVVVDEEQRFGVAHKERLKQLRTEVHVLTLSATPIPRTLNLALAGVRDMSVIETPPEDRLPIQTRVAEASTGLVRDAILRELDRGGQVFFVHNRVETIEAQAEQLRKLLPQARIVVAHGQMAEGELERVMLAFARGDYDVLVCTTIIESGLDIPNANTIIIDRADALGLAQLYQLRGRVGRSSRRAYAYLLYRKRGPADATSRASGCRRSSTRPSWAPASRSRCPTSRSAARATSWAPSSTASWRRLASTSTPDLLAEAVEEEKAARDGRRAGRAEGVDGHRPAGRRLPARRLRRGRAAQAGGLPAAGPDGDGRRGRRQSAPSWSTGLGPCRRRSSGCWRWRCCASPPRPQASRRWRAKGNELIIRFGEDWSRVATMRAMAPTSLDRPRARRCARRHHLRLEPDAGAAAQGPGGGVEHHARRGGAADQARAGVCGVASTSVLTSHTMLHTPVKKRRAALTRTNVTLPEELLREVDDSAGPRGRSQFVADAVKWKVKRERLRRALDAARGAFIGTESYMTPDEAYQWVRSMREEDGE